MYETLKKVEFASCGTIDDLEAHCLALLRLSNIDIDLKQASILEFFVGVALWCQDNKLNNETSLIYANIALEMLNYMALAKRTPSDILLEYRRILSMTVYNGDDESPPSSDYHGIQKGFSSLINMTFLRHCNLWNFLLHVDQDDDIVSMNLRVDQMLPAEAPFPPPLQEAMSHEMWEAFLKPPTPVAEPDGNAIAVMEELDVELPEELPDIDAKVLKKVIIETVPPALQKFSNDFHSKMIDKENNVIQKINQVHIVDK